MKKKILSIALAISLTFSLTAQAQEKEAALVILDTAAAIHQAVDKEMDEMAKMIEAGSVKDLHHHAFAVRDLVAALLDKSISLPQDKLAVVKSDVKFVATLADRLDTAGDSNDKAASGEDFKKLKAILDSMWANYPDAVR